MENGDFRRKSPFFWELRGAAPDPFGEFPFEKYVFTPTGARLVLGGRHAGEAAAGGRLPHCMRTTNHNESICKNTQSAAAFLEASY